MEGQSHVLLGWWFVFWVGLVAIGFTIFFGFVAWVRWMERRANVKRRDKVRDQMTR